MKKNGMSRLIKYMIPWVAMLVMAAPALALERMAVKSRSEERRVGKEG